LSPKINPNQTNNKPKKLPKKLIDYLQLLGFSALALLVVLSPFILMGRSLVWHLDGEIQHANFLEYMRDMGFFKMLGAYDYNSGFGGDFIHSYVYYSLFDPFSYLVYFIPFKNIFIAYSIIVILKFLTASIIMYWYLDNKKTPHKINIICSILYMLCGFAALTFVRHPLMAAGVMYLPMIMLGIDRIAARRRPYILIFGIFLTAISSYYMFFMVAIFVTMYTLLTFKKDIKTLLYVGLCAVLGTLMASYVLLPAYVGIGEAPRGTSKGMLWFGLQFYVHAFVNYFLTSLDIGTYHAIGMNALFLFIVFLALAKKSADPTTKSFKILFVLLSIGTVIPIFGYVFNAFNYVNNRWVFTISFIGIVLVSQVLTNIEKNAITRAEFNLASKWLKWFCISGLALMLVYNILAAIVLKNFWLVGVGFLYAFAIGYGVEIALIWLYLATFCLVFIAILIILGIKKWQNTYKITNTKYVLLGVCVTLVFIFYVPYSFTFTHWNDYVKTSNSTTITEYYRTDNSLKRGEHQNWTNLGAKNHTPSTFSYNSMSNSNTYVFLRENGVYNSLHTSGTTGLGNRAPLQSLMSVKYYDNKLYDNFIPFGFVYKNRVSRTVYNNLPMAERQYLMLDACVVEEETDFVYTPKLVEVPFVMSQNNFDGIKINAKNVQNKVVILTLNDFKPDKSNFAIGGAGWLFGTNGAKVNEVTLTLASYSTGRVYDYPLFARGVNKYDNTKDYVADFGRAETENLDIDIEYSRTAKFNFDTKNIHVYTYDEDANHFGETVQNLSKNHLQNITFDPHGFNGNITLTQGGTMFFSLPYSQDWVATVNGKTVALERANSGFIGLKLDAGTSDVKLSYESQDFKIGAMVTSGAICSLFIVAGFDVFFYIRRRNKRLFENK